jgi:hypothetical protein
MSVLKVIYISGAHGRFTPLSLGKHEREARVQTSDPNSWMVEVEKQGHGTRLAKQQSQLEQWVLLWNYFGNLLFFSTVHGSARTKNIMFKVFCQEKRFFATGKVCKIV